MNIYCVYTCVYINIACITLSQNAKITIIYIQSLLYNTIKTVQRILSESKLWLQLSILLLLGRWFCLNQKKKKNLNSMKRTCYSRWDLVVVVQSLSLSDFVTPWTVACQFPCPSLFPGVCSHSCPLSQWCHHPNILYSVFPFSSCLQSFPASRSFPVSWLFS